MSLLLVWLPLALSHAQDPAGLTLTRPDAERLELTLRSPLVRQRPMDLRVEAPPSCVDERPAELRLGPKALETRRWLRCDPAELERGEIGLIGLTEMRTEALLTLEGPEGRRQQRLTAASPSASLSTPPSPQATWLSLITLGAVHVLGGADHVAFLLGLLLITRGQWRPLLKVVTGFTLAHSLALGLASLGLLSVPGAPVEALIAASVLWMAVEATPSRSSQRRAEKDPASSGLMEHPWAASAVCGLAHGLGFAGALDALALPRDGLLQALLGFNLGVELGQLALIALALGLARAASCLPPPAVSLGAWLLRYGLGTLGAWWLWERVWDILS